MSVLDPGDWSLGLAWILGLATVVVVLVWYIVFVQRRRGK